MSVMRFFLFSHKSGRIGAAALAAFLAAAVILSPRIAAGQQVAPSRLTLSQIEQLITHGVPDSTMHTEIYEHGLAFTPNAAIVESLRAKGAGPLTLSAIKAFIPKKEQDPIITATAQPTSVNRGQAAVLTWSVLHALRVTLDGKPVQTHGTVTVSPTQTRPYLFKAINSQGKMAEKSVTVAVVAPIQQQTPTISLQATPGRIRKGETTTLSWHSANCVTVTINGVSMLLNGSQAFTPAQSTTYLAECKNQAGEASSVALIVVEPNSYTVVTGTRITVRMIDSLDSSKASAGQSFQANLDQDLLCGGQVAVPKGVVVQGRVDGVKKGRFGTEAELRLELTEIYINQQPQTVTTNITDLTSKGGGTGTGEGINTTVDGVIRDFHSNKVIVPSGAVLGFTLQQPFTATLNP